MTITLEVAKREDAKSLQTVRTEGGLPGVVYGPKQEAVPFVVSKKQFEKVYAEAGESTIITVTGLGEDMEVLVHDLAFNPVKGGVQHVDLYAIERGKELTTNVSLEFIGEAPVEKSGATVTKVLHEVSVTCRPSKLPARIEVDLTALVDESSQIMVSDLAIPEDVKIDLEPEDVVATVAAAREEEPEEAAEAPDMDAIEVEAKGKEDAAATEETKAD